MLFFTRQLTFLRVGYLNVGVACHAVRASLNCSLLRARLFWGGGGGIVAFEGFVLCAGGVGALYPNVMLLVWVGLRAVRHEYQWMNDSWHEWQLTCTLESGCWSVRSSAYSPGTGKAGPSDCLARVVWFGRDWGDRFATESVFFELLTRQDVFVIWEQNVDYVNCYKWCSRINDRSKD